MPTARTTGRLPRGGVGVQHHPRRTVAVDVDVHVEIGGLYRLDLGGDRFRRKGHRSEVIGGVAAARRQQCRPAAHERPVRPQLAGADLHMFRAQLAMPAGQTLGDGLRVVGRGAGPVGAGHPHRKAARLVLVDEVGEHPARVVARRADDRARLEVGRHPPRGRRLQGELLCGTDIRNREQVLGDQDRDRRGGLHRVAGGSAVGVAHPVLRTGVGIGGFGPDAGAAHGRGVEPRVVRVGGEEVHRPIAGDLVEPLPARGSLLEGVRHPGVAAQWRVRGLLRHPVADHCQHRVAPDDAGEVDAQFGQRHRGQMVVRIDEAGQAHPAAQVDLFGAGVDEVVGAVAGAHVQQVAAAHHHRLCPRLRRVAGPDRAPGEQVGLRHIGDAIPAGLATVPLAAVTP